MCAGKTAESSRRNSTRHRFSNTVGQSQEARSFAEPGGSFILSPRMRAIVLSQAVEALFFKRRSPWTMPLKILYRPSALT
jgi:hypothetical protein